MSAAQDYYDKTSTLLAQIRDSQMENVDKASEICAESISKGGLVFLFGCGHSRIMCEEMTPRQGGFVGFVAMVELAISNHSNIIGQNGLRGPLFLEKYEGYAEELLKGYKFGPNDAMVCISTSGIRPLIVEMAMGAKNRNMPVICMCSVPHSAQSPANHSSGKKLMDVADVVLDNHCPPGDCICEIEGMEWTVGPTSTVTGAMLMNMLRVETAEKLVARGHIPNVLPSHQFIGAEKNDHQLDDFYEGYRKSLAHLYQ